MKFMIMGAGGVGGYFGARLAEAGHEVVFVARGAHRDAIAANGLRVLSEAGDATIRPARVTDDPAEAGVCDGVLVCTKLRDLEAAAAAIGPATGPDTWVMGLQNGVEKDRVLTEAVGPDAVVGGTAHIAAVVEEPGVIRHTGTMARLIYGELDGRRSGRMATFDRAARGCRGFEAVLSDDIGFDIWRKLSFLAPFATVTCLFRSPIGPIRADAERRAVFAALVAEAAAVGRAAGIAFPDDHEARIMEQMDRLPEVMKSSMLHDLEAGRPLELDWLTGAVCRLGREHGVATPATDEAYAALARAKDGA
ncbi:MAG TPA: 2-dehydropantoate 2-reductase [Thermohalobaculum sp.]|nr:2-dehydropantoate 2-reductase [Thermohalobaculum sp.]